MHIGDLAVRDLVIKLLACFYFDSLSDSTSKITVEPLFANSPDNFRIAYYRSGIGPAIVLIMAEAAADKTGMKRAMSDASKKISPLLRLTCAVMARVTCQLTQQITPQIKWNRIFWPLPMPVRLRISPSGECHMEARLAAIWLPNPSAL